MVKELLDGWHELSSNRLEETKKEDKDYFSHLQEYNSLKLSRVSFFLKYCVRNARNYTKIWKNFEKILIDLGYDKWKVYDEQGIKGFNLQILGVLWVTIHEYFTLLKNPQHFGFNSFSSFISEDLELSDDIVLTEDEKLQQQFEEDEEDDDDEYQRRSEELKSADKLFEDFYMITNLSLRRCKDIIDDPKSHKDDIAKATNYREIILMYFVNHGDNKFVKDYYNVVPKWSKMTQKDRKIAINILSDKINKSDREYIRYYGGLAWLNFGLPKTMKNYENTLLMLFFAVTCKRSKKPENIFKGILLTDGDFYDGLAEEEVKYLQHSYCQLAKLVYLPFLYGYNISSVNNFRIYSQAREHLEKVRYEIDTVSDIVDIIEAVVKISKVMNLSLALNSVYINKKVDEYILLSKGSSNKVDVLEEGIIDYTMKVDHVFSNPAMHQYLKTFLDVFTSTYRVSEMIVKGIYNFTNVSKNQLSSNISTVLSLVPIIGELAWPVVDLSYERYESIDVEKIKQKA